MISYLPSPTPYQEINDFLSQLLARQQALLGEHLVGLYLGGSLALRAFNPCRSDIDFLVVTLDHLPPDLVSGLQDLHTKLCVTHSKWAKKLDGSYVPRNVVRHWAADHPSCPFVEGNQFQVTKQGSAVIQRHIIQEHGVIIVGSDPHDLIEPVSIDEMRSALRDMLETWWRHELENPSWVTQTQNQPFAILTMCRSLYIVEHGDVASKAIAGRWAQKALGQSWVELIEWALAWPHDQEVDHTITTLNLIAYTLDRFRQIEK